MPPIRPFQHKRGGRDPLKADEWNRLVDIVEGLANLSVAPPLRMLTTGKAQTIAMGPVVTSEFFVGKIHNLGPAAEANYTDQRYWVKEQEITNTGEADTTDLTWGDLTDGLWVTATNLAEVLSESHFLLDNNSYRVVVFKGKDQTPIPRYYFYNLGDYELGATDPHVMSPTPEGTEAPATGTWLRTNQPADKDGVSINVHTRTVYDEGTSETTTTTF